jgi:hypothetical protein
MLAYITRIIAAVSQLINTLFGGHQNESISTRSYRSGWTTLEKVIDNIIFWESNHCKKSHESDVDYAYKIVKDNPR